MFGFTFYTECKDVLKEHTHKQKQQTKTTNNCETLFFVIIVWFPVGLKYFLVNHSLD